MATTQPYRIRPGTWADLPQAASIFCQTIGNDDLVGILFPERYTHPEALRTWVLRRFQQRQWALGWRLNVLVDDRDEAVAFTWWNRGKNQESFLRRWLSPTAWIAPVIHAILRLRNYLFPIPVKVVDKFTAVYERETKKFINTPRRKNAWYLSTLAVLPDHQGRGFGQRLIQHGLALVDERGAAAWLIRVKDTEKFYGRYGFKEVGTLAVDEMAEWDSGEVMFRE